MGAAVFGALFGPVVGALAALVGTRRRLHRSRRACRWSSARGRCGIERRARGGAVVGRRSARALRNRTFLARARLDDAAGAPVRDRSRCSGRSTSPPRAGEPPRSAASGSSAPRSRRCRRRSSAGSSTGAAAASPCGSRSSPGRSCRLRLAFGAAPRPLRAAARARREPVVRRALHPGVRAARGRRGTQSASRKGMAFGLMNAAWATRRSRRPGRRRRDRRRDRRLGPVPASAAVAVRRALFVAVRPRPPGPASPPANLYASGRVAQRESTRFTREGSLVRSQPRPLETRRYARTSRNVTSRPRCSSHSFSLVARSPCRSVSSGTVWRRSVPSCAACRL